MKMGDLPMRNRNRRPAKKAITTGGNTPPSRVKHMATGGNTPPTATKRFVTGGNTPPVATKRFVTGGNTPPSRVSRSSRTLDRLGRGKPRKG